MSGSYYIHTYGCQMNERDADAVAALLERHGYVRGTEESADVVIVNTCSVRGKAEDKAVGKLGLLTAARARRPGRHVGAMGCMVQRRGVDLLAKVPGLDFGVGTQSLAKLPAILQRVRDGRGPVIETGTGADDLEQLAGHTESGPAAFVNILLGCDRRCAYCIVPAVRGQEWSRPAGAIVDEVRMLAGRGIGEVTLLGQSVMSYGRRNDVFAGLAASPRGFTEPLPRLLEAVDAVPGIARVRFTSGHPVGVTPELARAMAELPSVCEHLHLPLQSGADRILRAMRRGYDADGYRQAVARLRERVPDLALTTDIIVGFPGETAADFDLTRRFMDEIGFDNAFIFKYSPRPGTPAAEWPDDVSEAEKMQRNQVLLSDQELRGLRLNERLVGTTVEVLVEGESRRNAARWSGRTRGNKIVIFEQAPGVQVGDRVLLRVTRAMPQTLYGERV